MLRYVYVIALGFLTAIFVTVGILTFYPAPVPPQYPEQPEDMRSLDYYPYPSVAVDVEISEEEAETRFMEEAKYTHEITQFNKESEEFNKKVIAYNHNNMLATVVIAALLILAGLLFLRKYPTFPEALILGAALLLYNTAEKIRYSTDPYSPMIFAVVAGAFLLMTVAGYFTYVHKKK